MPYLSLSQSSFVLKLTPMLLTSTLSSFEATRSRPISTTLDNNSIERIIAAILSALQKSTMPMSYPEPQMLIDSIVEAVTARLSSTEGVSTTPVPAIDSNMLAERLVEVVRMALLPPITPTLTLDSAAIAEEIIAIIADRIPSLPVAPEKVKVPPPVVDQIRVSNQESTGTYFNIDELIAVADRWLVVYQRLQTDVQVVSRVYVPAGTYINIKIPFQRSVQRGTELTAVLHQDTGQMQNFDFPVFDPLVMGDGAKFVLGLPSIAVADQVGSVVRVDSVLMTEAGWIVVYDDESQQIVGVQALPTGLTTQVRIPVKGLVRDVQRRLRAVVYVDRGRLQEFEFPGPDTPVLDATGSVVQAPFDFTYQFSQTAAPTPVVHISAPALFSPPSLAPYDQERITVQWRWDEVLRENWGFEVRGWLTEGPHNGIHDARITEGMVPNEFGIYSLNLPIPAHLKGRTWYWTVAVVQLDPYEQIGPEAPPYIVAKP